MSCRLEPAVWSRDTAHQIPCFDRCQLIRRGMSNIKEVHSKPRLHAPTSNTAVHDNHEKIHIWVSFSYMVMGLRLAVLRNAGAPL